MADKPSTGITIGEEWKGLVSNADPHDIPPGAMQSQENCYSRYPGQMNVRLGMKLESDLSDSGTEEIITTFTYEHPQGDFLVTVDTAGDIKALRGGTVKTIKSGVKVDHPWSFQKTRNGDIIGVNGLNRGIRWDGTATAADALGITAPDTAPTVLTPAHGSAGATAGSYTLAYRYVDNTLSGFVYSELSPIQTVTAVADDKFNWTVIPSSPSPQSRVVKKELWRSASNQPNVLYFVAIIAVGDTAYTTDTSSDQTLIDAAISNPKKRLVVVGPSGEVIGRRQGVPPNTKPVVCEFQDRTFYAGFPKYSTGTVTTSSGATGITGSGTAWIEEFVGRYIYFTGDTRPYEIASFTNATSMALASNANSSLSGVTYVIAPNADERNTLFYSFTNEAESVHSTYTVTVQENIKDNDDIVAIFPFGSLLYIFKTKHVYTLSFMKQPTIDADARLLAHRGLVNHQCCDVFEGTFYGMDRYGIYSMSLGGSITPLSMPIQDLFRSDTTPFEWGDSEWWFVVADPTYEQIRFHVGYTADSSTRPMRALVYDVRRQSWHTEKFVQELGGGSRFTKSGEIRVMYGGMNEDVLMGNGAKTDYLSAEVRGTATGGSSNTIVDSGASFGSAHVGAPVAIISGTGKHQVRRVASATSTTLTVTPNWSTNPVSTSGYLVGGILWSFKTGVFDLPGTESRDVHSIEALIEKQADGGSHDMRLYIDRATTAQNWETAMNTEGVSTTAADPDAVFTLTNQDGVYRKRFGGMYVHGSKGKSFIELESRGSQGNSEVKIYQINIEGAE